MKARNFDRISSEFDLSEFESSRGTILRPLQALLFIETAQMFSGDLRADLISYVDDMIHKYILYVIRYFLEKKKKYN